MKKVNLQNKHEIIPKQILQTATNIRTVNKMDLNGLNRNIDYPSN